MIRHLAGWACDWILIKLVNFGSPSVDALRQHIRGYAHAIILPPVHFPIRALFASDVQSFTSCWSKWLWFRKNFSWNLDEMIWPFSGWSCILRLLLLHDVGNIVSFICRNRKELNPSVMEGEGDWTFAVLNLVVAQFLKGLDENIFAYAHAAPPTGIFAPPVKRWLRI